jgi:hypothetical protein
MAGLGRKVFTAGDVLTASDVQNYLMDQTVMNFAGTAARSSAIATPTTGMTTYIGTTGTATIPQIESYTGSSFQTLYGQTLVANVSFTSTATVQINNVFTSAYDNYLIVMRYTQNTSTGDLSYQNSLSGTPAATGYGGNGYVAYANGLSTNGFVTGAGGFTGTKLSIANSQASIGNFITATINSPALASATTFITNFYGRSTGYGGNTSAFISGIHETATAYDGMTITTSAGTMTGNIRVYGLRNS